MPATRYFPSDVRNKTQKRNDERCEFISEHYLAFAVTLMLEMMMKRRHEKNSLFRPSEMQNLNYNGYARQDEHYAHNRNKERISAENAYRSDKSAERKRTRIVSLRFSPFVAGIYFAEEPFTSLPIRSAS